MKSLAVIVASFASEGGEGGDRVEGSFGVKLAMLSGSPSFASAAVSSSCVDDRTDP